MTQQELELPKGWAETTLGDSDISEIIMGQSPPGSTYNKEKNGMPFFQGIKDFGEKFPIATVWCTGPKKIAIKGDILLSVRAPVGTTNWATEECCIGRGLVAIRPKIEPEYVYYFLKSIQIKLSGSGVGSVFNAINKSELCQISLPLPPLNEQKRIVSKIEELFSKIDSTKQSLEYSKLQLVQYRHSLLKSAFEGKLTEKWREENKPTPDIQWLDYDKKKNSIMKIYNENLQDLIIIPKDWYWLDIKSLSESMKNGIYKQKKFYTKDGIACLRMYNIENWSLVWKKIKRLELTPNEISEYKLEFNDILVNRVNSMELVGKSALIPKNIEECVFESKNIRLRLKTEYIKPQLAHLWLLVASRHYFYNNFQQTTGMASINQIQLGQLPIPFCSMEEQEQIVFQIEQGFTLIENSQNIVNSTLQTLETMRMSVLKQAFQGKLVPQDPNDEPASILLEKIKKAHVDLKPKQWRAKNVK